jgi:threonine dehydrogenase-like Zn-dependent dehydrogenase
MRAVRSTEAGIVVDEAAPVREPGPGEVRVHVRAAGICGSDLHALERAPIPVIPGHEVAGVLDDGTPVAIWPLTPCGRCERCRAGEPQQCPGAPWDLYGFGRDGGMADEVVVERSTLVPLPAGLAPAAGALVEPLACAVHGAHRAGLQRGQRVAVVGGGTMGLALVAVARALGCDVALEARHAHQRQAGEALGATVAPAGAAAFDVVVDAAGTADAAARVVDLARPGATALLLATYWDGLHLPPLEFAMKELTLVPASSHGRTAVGRDVDGAAALLAADPRIAQAIVTHRFALEEAPEAFRVAADRKAGAIKVMIEP